VFLVIKLIVGLGNPGSKYIKTRHNAGFLFLDRAFADEVDKWVLDSRFEAYTASVSVAGCELSLLKPHTFMNRSGQSVGKFARYYKLLPEQVLVVHDELDFDVGVAKLKKGGGHAGHNGLRDIISHLGSGDFYRLRLGIGRPSAEKAVVNYVLSEPASDELSLLLQAFDRCQNPVRFLVLGEAQKAVSELNCQGKQ